MKIKAFGSTALRVSELGFGCARIGGIFQTGGDGFVELLDAAYDAGITFFDTADMYSQGESETLVGRALRGKRQRIVIATKAGYVLPGRRRLIARIKPLVRPLLRPFKIRRDQLPVAVRGTVTQDFSPAYLTRAVEGSLRRMRTDYLDLLQLHSPPTEIIQRGAWQDALEQLKRVGKIRFYGISCDSVEAGLAALEFPISSLQVALNLLEPGAASQVLPKARAKGVAVIARECLANGLLVKAAADVDWARYCRTPEEQAHRVKQLTEVRARAAAQGRPLGAFAVDYVTELEGVSVALVGASTKQQLKSLLAQVRTERAR